MTTRLPLILALLALLALPAAQAAPGSAAPRGAAAARAAAKRCAATQLAIAFTLAETATTSVFAGHEDLTGHEVHAWLSAISKSLGAAKATGTLDSITISTLDYVLSLIARTEKTHIRRSGTMTAHEPYGRTEAMGLLLDLSNALASLRDVTAMACAR